MSGILKKCSFAITYTMFFGAAVFAQQPSGPNQLSFSEFRDRCLHSGTSDPAFEMTGDPDLEEFNVKCSHQVAYDNGNNLLAVFESYLAKKYDKAKKASESGVPIGEAAKDGTCTKEDVSKGQSAGWADCLGRLKTMIADAKIQARDAYLKNNTQKLELLDEQNRRHAVGQQNQNQQAPKNAMLRDLYRSSRRNSSAGAPASPVGSKVIYSPIYKGLRTVDFGSDKNVNADTTEGKVGSSLLNAKKDGFVDGESKDVSKINQGAVERVVGKSGTTIDVEGKSQNAALTKKAKDKALVIDSKVRSLRESLIKDSKKRQSQSNQENAEDDAALGRGISSEAFEETMDEYDKAAKEKQAKYGRATGISGTAPADPNEQIIMVDKKIAAPKPSSNGSAPAPASTTVDKDISDTLDDLK